MNRLNLVYAALLGAMMVSAPCAYAQGTPLAVSATKGRLKSVSTDNQSYTMQDNVVVKIAFTGKPCGFQLEARDTTGKGLIYDPLYPNTSELTLNLDSKPKNWGVGLGKVMLTISPAPADRKVAGDVQACEGEPVRTSLTLVTPQAPAGSSVSGGANLKGAVGDQNKPNTANTAKPAPDKAPARY